MPPCFCGIDLEKRAIAKRVYLLKLGFVDEILDAHTLDKHFSFGLIRFLEDAFCGRFLDHCFFGYLPAVPEIKFVVVENNSRAVGAMRSPSAAALTFRPHVSDEEDEPVDEAKLRSERKIGLKLFSRALREVAQPAGKRLSANFPRKLRDQFFPDGSGAIV